LSTLHNFLRGTDAAALLDERSEKTAAGVRMTAGTYARSFGYLRQKETEFHFREWVQNDKGDDWVFLNARPDQITAVRPVLSAWLEVFTNALLSLSASRKRRIWLVVDELPSLNKIPSLSSFLAQARKYGGCGVIAFQQIAQLREIYGHDGAEALSGLCATWTCLRQNDPDTAKWTAQSFGETEILEAQQGLSYGANDMRDGVSLQQNRRSRALILPTEIANLADLEGYIRLPGDAPIGHFKMKWSHKKTIAEEFVHSRAAPIVEPIPDDDGRAIEQGMTMSLFSGGDENAANDETDDAVTAPSRPRFSDA
jgi:type IV secretory pathway TraG/TraD family ATPase VirD4